MTLETAVDRSLRERIDSERRYHEEHYRNSSAPLELSFDLATSDQRRGENLTWAHFDSILAHFSSGLGGKRILDVGCGSGLLSLNLAKRGATVDAFDLSREAIDICVRRARHHALGGANFFVSSMEDLDLPGEGYDAVVGGMILHHIDIPTAMDKVFRWLKPGAAGVFAEWKVYPVVDRLRRTPLARRVFPAGGVEGYATEFERKLTRRDFAAIRSRFPNVQLDYRYCLCGKVQYFSPTLAARLERLDYRILKALPMLRQFTDGVIIRFTKPDGQNDTRP